MTNIKVGITTILLAVFMLTGCLPDEESPSSALEVNNENCKPEIIITIKPAEAREKFSTKCSTRGKFKQTPVSDR